MTKATTVMLAPSAEATPTMPQAFQPTGCHTEEEGEHLDILE